MRGFEETAPTPRLVHLRGERQVIVEAMGIVEPAGWGYTIWQGSRCLCGKRDETWTRDDAVHAALATVAAMENTP